MAYPHSCLFSDCPYFCGVVSRMDNNPWIISCKASHGVAFNVPVVLNHPAEFMLFMPALGSGSYLATCCTVPVKEVDL